MKKSYTGIKQVYAIPMTRLEYNVLRGWELPKDENGDDKGYLVEYTDGGKSNHPDFAGYISWSPADVFANAYHENVAPIVHSETVHHEFKSIQYYVFPDTTTTVCCIELHSGFTVIGKSACVHKANFDEATGRTYAYRDAVREVHQFLGFRMSDEAHKTYLASLAGDTGIV